MSDHNQQDSTLLNINPDLTQDSIDVGPSTNRPARFSVFGQSGQPLGSIVSPPDMDTDRPNEETLTRGLLDQLFKTMRARQEQLDLKADIALKYEQVLAHLPQAEDARELAAATARQQYDDQLAPVQAELTLLEERIQRLQDTLKERTSAKQAKIQLEEETQPVPSPVQSIYDHQSDLDMPPLLNNPKHAAMMRVFNYKTIPVLSRARGEIDYDRVQLKEKSNAPSFKLKLKGVPKNELTLKIVKGIVDFIEKFEKFYVRELTKDLFEDLAWRYMSMSLEAAGLSDQYDEHIKTVEYGDRSWTQVQRCLNRILKLDIMKIRSLQLFVNATLEPNEDANTFVDRMEALIKASDAYEMGQLLVSKILDTLPDAGREKIITEFQSLTEEDTAKDILAYIRLNPSVLMGQRSDPTAWLVNKFSEEADDEPKAERRVLASPECKRLPHKRYQFGQRPAQGAARPGQRVLSHTEAFYRLNPKEKDEKFSRGKAKMNAAMLHELRNDSLIDTVGHELAHDINNMEIDAYDKGSAKATSIPIGNVSIVRAVAAATKASDKAAPRSTNYAAAKASRPTGFRHAAPGDNRIAVPIQDSKDRHILPSLIAAPRSKSSMKMLQKI
ncbi:hypothetical protein B0O80DRAFT_500866 [Mortierella sp. GBAus27b]|nr:hypothetical protein B0O80DRAFT_500866 [Mortierella sp. GBAus27b]